MGLDRMPGFVTLMATVSAITGIYYIERGSRQRIREKYEANEIKDEEIEPAPSNLVSRILDGSPLVPNSVLLSEKRIHLSEANISHLSGR